MAVALGLQEIALLITMAQFPESLYAGTSAPATGLDARDGVIDYPHQAPLTPRR